MKKINVLDKGFVELVDSMGDDQRIVQSARVSVKDAKKYSEDEALIRYLMRHRHSTPFEMVEVCFHIKMPIFLARQHMRHRTANINEISGRYSILPEECYVPDLTELKKQSKENHQGVSDEQLSDVCGKDILIRMQETTSECFRDYKHFVESHELAKEMARINLPLSTYTEFYWKIDLHNLFHYLSLRMESHAQKQIRDYANAMAKLVKPIVPIAWSAFEDYRLNAMNLTKYDIVCLGKMLNAGDEPVNMGVRDFPTKREFNEFLKKLELLGLPIEGKK